MNERIRDLEKQATETVECGLNGTHTAIRFNRKKFAELLIQECANWINDNVGLVDEQARVDLLKHFGVEE